MLIIKFLINIDLAINKQTNILTLISIIITILNNLNIYIINNN